MQKVFLIKFSEIVLKIALKRTRKDEMGTLQFPQATLRTRTTCKLGELASTSSYN